jgi:hypothetical protein
MTRFILLIGVNHHAGADRMCRQKANVPIASMTVEVSEATYVDFFYRSLGLTRPVDFTEPIDDNWWTTHANFNPHLSVHGMAWEG